MSLKFYPRHLPKMIALVGIGFIAFYGVAAVFTFFGWTDELQQSHLGLLALRLAGHNGVEIHAEHYEVMICVIYMIWGWFLLSAAHQPAKNISFLDFTVTANLAHFGVMSVMAIVVSDNQIHFFWDLFVGWILLLLLMVFWIPSRKFYLSQQDTDINYSFSDCIESMDKEKKNDRYRNIASVGNFPILPKSGKDAGI